MLWIHSDGNDRSILDDEPYLETLASFRDAGMTRAIGFSGKTIEGNRSALAWADAIMVEYHLQDRSHEPLILEAADRGVGVVIKKAASKRASTRRRGLEICVPRLARGQRDHISDHWQHGSSTNAVEPGHSATSLTSGHSGTAITMPTTRRSGPAPIRCLLSS